MALLGFNALDSVLGVQKTGWSLQAPGNWSAPAGRSGGFCLRAGGNTDWLKFSPPTPVTELVAGHAVKWNATNEAGQTTVRLLGFLSAASTEGQVYMQWDGAGHLILKRGNEAATVATSSQVWPNDGAWRYVEARCIINDTGGRYIAKVDGATWIDFTGDTQYYGTENAISAVGSAGYDLSFDDFYVCDTTGAAPYNDFLGDVKVETLYPNGNGASSTWLGSDGNSTDNYLLVDENPPNTTDYVGSSTVGNRDLYTATDLSTTVGQILGTQVSVYAQKSDAGAANIKTVTRGSSGTAVTSAAIALSTSWAMIAGDVRTTDPDGATWTPTSVNAAQIGVETA